MEQGTHEWLMARLGKPTASRFDQIITPSTRKPSKSAKGLRHRLLAEEILGYPLDDVSNEWTHRGTTMEAEAVAWYELQRDVTVQRVGFVLRDNEKVGASPDGLVGEDGGLEIKCFSAPRHIECLLGDDPASMTQVQGCMWICERAWWDVLAYNPVMPPVLVRVQRDPEFIEALEVAVNKFLTDMDNARRKIAGMGAVGRVADSDLKVELRKALAFYGGSDPAEDGTP